MGCYANNQQAGSHDTEGAIYFTTFEMTCKHYPGLFRNLLNIHDLGLLDLET